MLIFTLAIIGIAVCGITAPVAWFMGITYRRQCLDAEVPEDQFAVIGRVVGMIGSIVFLGSTLAVAAVVAIELLVFWLAFA